jgi:hypothetical protein
MPTFRSIVTLNHPNLGGTATNSFHFVTEPGATSGEITDQVTSAAGALEAMYTQLAEFCYVGNTVIQHSGEWVEVGVEDPEFAISPAWTETVGDIANGMPPHDCLVVTWRTALAGRSGRGRTFLSPLNDVALEADGTPTASFRTLVEAAADEIITYNGDPDQGQFVVWSPTDEIARSITSRSTRNIFASLRSRRD